MIISWLLELAQLLVLIYIARKEFNYLFPTPQVDKPKAKFFTKQENMKRKPIAHDESELYEREIQSQNPA